ncbi:tetratricopeptide repeat protein [Pseudoduganella sp. OTU4001]|uniref:tetratricopeptide repeat protein n=1 Tax=Pseudoduganella sp. OTU4001 TaxID=3043854 RepID=UPI00313D253F
MQIKVLCAALALLGAASVASADDLADGIKAWETQDYARAHQLLGKLAQAGNSDAQVLVGEMYAFGEGVAEDPAQAEQWLNKAKAAGNKDAPKSLLVLQQRQSRKAEIEFYRTAYTGDELAYGKHGCAAPQFPEVAKDPEETKAVQAKMAEWSECFKRFGQGLAAALPAGKLIPATLVPLMNQAELKQARATMDKAYAKMIGEGEQTKQQVIAAHNAWVERTEAWAKLVTQKSQEDVAKNMRANEKAAERVRSAARTPTGGSGPTRR